MRNPAPLRSAFTLIELLVVVAIIGILAAMLLPAMSKARQKANLTVCMSQQKQFHLAYVMYADDFNGYRPLPCNSRRAHTYENWADQYSGQKTVGNIGALFLTGYLSDPRIAWCTDYPAGEADLAGLQEIADTETRDPSQGNSCGYIVRGADFSNGYKTAHGTHFNNAFLWDWSTNPPGNTTALYGYSHPKLEQNAVDVQVNGGNSTMDSARAMLSCRIPEPHYSSRKVHNGERFNVMFADGVVAEANAIKNYKFMLRNDSWYRKWWGMDTQHPSFTRPYSSYASGWYP